MALWVMHARAEPPPACASHADRPPQTAPVEWFVLTTLAIASPDEAVQGLRWDCLRWRIEDGPRVVKSGCRIEALAHKTVERLRRAIAIHVVIAWRMLLMTLLGRATPDVPAEVRFSDVERKVLHAYAKQNGGRPPRIWGMPCGWWHRLAGTWAEPMIRPRAMH